MNAWLVVAAVLAAAAAVLVLVDQAKAAQALLAGAVCFVALGLANP